MDTSVGLWKLTAGSQLLPDVVVRGMDDEKG